jgi:agmatinase
MTRSAAESRMRPAASPFTLAVHEARTGAAAAFFGAPLDLTGSFRLGAAGGPAAVRRLSDSLETYSPALDRDLEDLELADLGDIDLDGLEVEAAVDAIAATMEEATRSARLPVMFGGEHTVSLGGFRGVKRVYPDAMLLQVDAHPDLREEYNGRTLNHATWSYHAGTEFGFDSIVQLGLRSGAREEWPRTRDLLWSDRGLELPADVRTELEKRPVYLTIDIDVLDPSVAPATGCPEPGGASFGELESFLHGLAGMRVVALDVVEVAPEIEPSEITEAAAAKLVREAVLMFGSGGIGRR